MNWGITNLKKKVSRAKIVANLKCLKRQIYCDLRNKQKWARTHDKALVDLLLGTKLKLLFLNSSVQKEGSVYNYQRAQDQEGAVKQRISK